MNESNRIDASQVIRRQDLIALGDDFKSALAPLAVVIRHLEVARRTMRATQVLVVTSALLAVLNTCMLVLVSYRLASAVNKMSTVQHGVEETARQLTGITIAVNSARATAERVEDKANTQPSLQLLPELDPVKARHSPVKLIVAVPAEPSDEMIRPRQSSSTPQASIAIPLAAENFQ